MFLSTVKSRHMATNDHGCTSLPQQHPNQSFNLKRRLTVVRHQQQFVYELLLQRRDVIPWDNQSRLTNVSAKMSQLKRDRRDMDNT